LNGIGLYSQKNLKTIHNNLGDKHQKVFIVNSVTTPSSPQEEGSRNHEINYKGIKIIPAIMTSVKIASTERKPSFENFNDLRTPSGKIYKGRLPHSRIMPSITPDILSRKDSV